MSLLVGGCYFTLMVNEAHDISGHDHLRVLIPVIDFNLRTNNDSNQQMVSLNMINK